MIPYKTQNFVHEWVDFSEFSPIWANFKFKKILEKSGDFALNLARNWDNWYMNGSPFLEKLAFVGSTFKFCGGTSLRKPNLSIPGAYKPVADWPPVLEWLPSPTRATQQWDWLTLDRKLFQHIHSIVTAPLIALDGQCKLSDKYHCNFLKWQWYLSDITHSKESNLANPAHICTLW